MEWLCFLDCGDQLFWGVVVIDSVVCILGIRCFWVLGISFVFGFLGLALFLDSWDLLCFWDCRYQLCFLGYTHSYDVCVVGISSFFKLFGSALLFGL